MLRQTHDGQAVVASGWLPFAGIRSRSWPRYLTLLHTKAAADPPTEGAVLVYFSSSPTIVKFVRPCSVPFQFGNELYSTRRIRSVPLTEYVPKYEMLPPPMALYSSEV